MHVFEEPWSRRCEGREETLWLAAAVSPFSWIAYLAGAPLLLALALTVVAGVFTGHVLRQLYVCGDRSPGRAWFLAQTGTTLAVVCTLLVLIS